MKNINNFKLQKELLKEARKDLRIVKEKMKKENNKYAEIYATGDRVLIESFEREINDIGLIWEWREYRNTIRMSSFRMRRIIRKSRRSK